MSQLFGWNTLQELRTHISQLGAKPLIVRGKASYEKSGAYQQVDPLGGVHFSDFKTNPHIEDIEKAIELFKEYNCDMVLGVGGGTAMDIAKSVAILAPLEGKPADYITKKQQLPSRTIPLTLIPTTSGTGSESTKFSVVYVNKTKHSLKHDSLIPDFSIVDPKLTMSLPPYMTACTGMDALSQAIEAFWSIHSTEESKEYSKQAIPLLLNNLAKAVNENDKEARIAVARASNLSGKAINIAFTTAAHAVSYPMTSHFGVPHGLACGLTLPHWLVFNAQAEETSRINEKRGYQYLKDSMEELIQIMGCETAYGAGEKIISLMKQCGLPTTLSEAGIFTNADHELIIANGFNPDRVVNNPIVVTQEVLRKLLQSIA